MSCFKISKKNSVSLFAFLLLLLVLAISVATVDALCEVASQTWSGDCKNMRHCDDQCKAWEQVEHGACHTRNGKKMCFCYFNKCPSKAAKLAKDKLKGEEVPGDTVQGEKPPVPQETYGYAPFPQYPMSPPYPRP